jgi:electron transfer flavoprotein alpha subunit
MKIALVATGDENLTLNEFGSFLANSRLAQMECERWQLPPMEMAENGLSALAAQFARSPVDMLLFPSGWQGAELATRLAFRLGGDALCNVSQGEFIDRCSVHKTVCGGAMIAELGLQKMPWCLNVVAAPGAEDWLAACPTIQLEIEATQPEWLIGQSIIVEESASGLAQAKRVLAAGRGAENADNMRRLSELAATLGAEPGASREAVMHAWCGMERLIGVSGAQVAAEICIVAGVSGASAFTSAIGHSQFIVAINNDPRAPVFAQADVGIVDELLPVLEALAEIVTEEA